MSNIYEDAHLGHIEKPGPSQEIGNISRGKGIIMGNNTTKEPKNKAFREWIRSIGTFIGGLGILIGLINFLFTKEKEASDRLLNIINLLDRDKCQTVRAGAVTTMGVYLRDYKQYQDRAFWVMASNLATEDDQLVRRTILNILRKAEADAIEPLIFNNRILFKTEIAKGEYDGSVKDNLIEAVSTGQFQHDRLQDINMALATILRKSSMKEFRKLDLSKVFFASPTAEYINLKNVKLEGVDLNRAIFCRVDLSNAMLQQSNLEDASLVAVILKDAELSDAKLAKVNLVSADLERAKLVKADLCGANLVDANLAEAVLDKANIYGAYLTNSILRNASLKDAILTGADLQYADLRMADLRGANLTDANLAHTVLQGANLEGADLRSVELKNADLRGLVLFEIDSGKFRTALNKSNILEELRQEFKDNGYSLYENTHVSVVETNRMWLLNDLDNKQTYFIRNDEQLNISEGTGSDMIEMFRIDYNKFQSNFDKGIISEDLCREFKDDWIDLSQNTDISVKEKGRIWQMNDKENKQTYTVRKKELLIVCKETKFDLMEIKKAENWERAVYDEYVQRELSIP